MATLEQIDLTAAAAEEPGPEPEPEPESEPDPEPETLEDFFDNTLSHLNSGHGTALENSRIRAYKRLRKRIRAEDKDFPHGILGALKNAIVNDDKVTARTAFKGVLERVQQDKAASQPHAAERVNVLPAGMERALQEAGEMVEIESELSEPLANLLRKVQAEIAKKIFVNLPDPSTPNAPLPELRRGRASRGLSTEDIADGKIMYEDIDEFMGQEREEAEWYTLVNKLWQTPTDMAAFSKKFGKDILNEVRTVVYGRSSGTILDPTPKRPGKAKARVVPRKWKNRFNSLDPDVATSLKRFLHKMGESDFHARGKSEPNWTGKGSGSKLLELELEDLQRLVADPNVVPVRVHTKGDNPRDWNKRPMIHDMMDNSELLTSLISSSGGQSARGILSLLHTQHIMENQKGVSPEPIQISPDDDDDDDDIVVLHSPREGPQPVVRQSLAPEAVDPDAPPMGGAVPARNQPDNQAQVHLVPPPAKKGNPKGERGDTVHQTFFTTENLSKEEVATYFEDNVMLGTMGTFKSGAWVKRSNDADALTRVKLYGLVLQERSRHQDWKVR